MVAAGNDDYGQCGISSWKDILAVAAGSFHTVGLCEDGSVICVGSNKTGQIDNWLLFEDAGDLEQIDREFCLSMIEQLRDEYSELKYEMSNIHGLFSNKRQNEIEARMKDIRSAVRRLKLV